jgi:hypothetical protein
MICINNKPFEGNDVAPPLEVGKDYPILNVIEDKKGNKHYDVGLKSKHNYITSFETGETLPNSKIGGVHWCHPSRFQHPAEPLVPVEEQTLPLEGLYTTKGI